MSTLNKTMLRFVTSILSVVLWMGIPTLTHASSVGCDKEVYTFLATPNKLTFSALTGARAPACWKVIGSSNDNLDRLTQSVERGNQWSAQYLAKHLNNLDGGNLEDSLIALGKFGEHHMELLLNFVKEGELSNDELRDAMTMLPLSLSDDLNAQLNVLKVRRRLIMKVTRSDLQVQKEIALKATHDFEVEIRSHMHEQ